jgi:hypothetical protein
MRAKGAAPGGDRDAAGSKGNETSIPRARAGAKLSGSAKQEPTFEPSSPEAAWKHATGLAVVLERSTSSAKDVIGLGEAWAVGVELWLATGLRYLILSTTSREGLQSPNAIMARDVDALRLAVQLVFERTSNINVLWANCADVATWEIVSALLAERMPACNEVAA